VPVLYEGRTAQGAVKDGASLDELFEDLFRERSAEELEAIKRNPLLQLTPTTGCTPPSCFMLSMRYSGHLNQSRAGSE
jgi:hypothetical protein